MGWGYCPEQRLGTGAGVKLIMSGDSSRHEGWVMYEEHPLQ